MPPGASANRATESPASSSSSSSELWWWFAALVVPLYVGTKCAVAMRFPILADCDEVFNYWEPLHYLLYHTGQQTWEYAHEFALRTYAYLVPLQYWAEWVLLQQLHPLLVAPLQNEKLALFLHLRGTLAAATACAEVYFLYALYGLYHTSPSLSSSLSSLLLSSITSSSTTTQESPPPRIRTASTTTKMIVSGTAWLFLTGMTGPAGASYLPSSTWMAVWCVCAAMFLQRQHVPFVAVAVTATLTTGWPFGAVSVVPMALHILAKEATSFRRLLWFLLQIGFVTAVVQAGVLYVDYQHYGTLVVATWNIAKYNAGNSGDELYGVEPLSYYIKNVLLNLNVAALFGLMALPVYVTCPSLQRQERQALSRVDWNLVSVLACLPAWLAITVPRPHKEERFLYPIYPVLMFGAVVTVDTVVSRLVVPVITTTRRQRLVVRWIAHSVLLWIPFALLSISRTTALYRYYSAAPQHVYASLALPTNNNTTTSDDVRVVCTCGEWYRFPSSFYLPPNTQLGYLPSSFRGQLPQPFSRYGSRPESRTVLQPFNNINAEQVERYMSPKNCHFVVDWTPNQDCVSQFAVNQLQIQASWSLLNAQRTTSTLHRILYLPYWHEWAVEQGRVVYDPYVLYQVRRNQESEESSTPERTTTGESTS